MQREHEQKEKQLGEEALRTVPHLARAPRAPLEALLPLPPSRCPYVVPSLPAAAGMKGPAEKQVLKGTHAPPTRGSHAPNRTQPARTVSVPRRLSWYEPSRHLGDEALALGTSPGPTAAFVQKWDTGLGVRATWNCRISVPLR